MITRIDDLKERVNNKTPKIIVSKELLARKGSAENSPWVDVGFSGFAGIIKTSSLFFMSFFSKKWDKDYVQKKLQYRYSAILEDEDSITFNLNQ